MLFQFLGATHIPWLVSPFSISKASNDSMESFSHHITLTLTSSAAHPSLTHIEGCCCCITGPISE